MLYPLRLPLQWVPHFLSLPLSLMQDTIQQTFVPSFPSHFYSNDIAHPRIAFRLLTPISNHRKPSLHARNQILTAFVVSVTRPPLTPALFLTPSTKRSLHPPSPRIPLILKSQLSDSIFHLDHQPDIVAEVQDQIDWDLFRGQGVFPHTLFLLYLLSIIFFCSRSHPSAHLCRRITCCSPCTIAAVTETTECPVVCAAACACGETYHHRASVSFF
jgi:hypothetical protein